MDAELLERYRPKIYSYALRISHSREDAEDLTQETLIRTVRADSLDMLGNPLSYLYRVCARLNLDRVRLNSRRVKAMSIEAWESENIDGLEFEARAEPPEVAMCFDELRASLSEVCRDRDRPLLDGLASEMTYDEMALAAGVPIGTVRSRVHRMRERMIREFPQLAA